MLSHGPLNYGFTPLGPAKFAAAAAWAAPVKTQDD